MIPSEALGGGGPEDGIPLLSLWQRWAGKQQQQQQRDAMGGCVAWRVRWGGCGGRAALTSRGEVAQREGEWERESGETAEGRARHREWAPGTGKGCPGAAGQGRGSTSCCGISACLGISRGDGGWLLGSGNITQCLNSLAQRGLAVGQ